MSKTILKGITWGHSRGITPLLAAAQRYNELYPDVEIIWKKRSLQEFADFPIEKLTEEYDLLVIDHPWVGCAAATNCVLPLDQFLPEPYLADQLASSVGGSHQSYNYAGHQWALAIDAATPAASYRADLFASAGKSVPTTWEEVLQLGESGKIALPAIPIDTLMNFYTFCLAYGEEPFISEKEVISPKTGLSALYTMRVLYTLIDKKMFDWNPIAVAEAMTKTDNYWYCPFAYCYSNYSRDGYAASNLTYTALPLFNNQHLHSTVGGTGLSVSAFSRHKEAALHFAQWIVSPQIQSTLYVEHGGQPGHRLAWEDEKANSLTNNFFRNVLPVMQRGYIRPRYNGYLQFQDEAGHPLQQYLRKGGDAEEVLKELNHIYQTSFSQKEEAIHI